MIWSWWWIPAYILIGFLLQLAAYYVDGADQDNTPIIFFLGVAWPIGLVLILVIGAGWLFKRAPEVAAEKLKEQVRDFKIERQEKKRIRERETQARAGAVTLASHEGGEISLR